MIFGEFREARTDLSGVYLAMEVRHRPESPTLNDPSGKQNPGNVSSRLGLEWRI
jgi:hypothetical protein